MAKAYKIDTAFVRPAGVLEQPVFLTACITEEGSVTRFYPTFADSKVGDLVLGRTRTKKQFTDSSSLKPQGWYTKAYENHLSPRQPWHRVPNNPPQRRLYGP